MKPKNSPWIIQTTQAIPAQINSRNTLRNVSQKDIGTAYEIRSKMRHEL